MTAFARLLSAALITLGLAVAGAAAFADGLPVSTASGRQHGVRLVARPGGGAWLAWLDERSGYSVEVFGARLDAAGTPSTGGADQGDTLTWITCRKRDLAFAADGTGGTLAAWSDHRCESALGFDVYLLRLDASGRPLASWPANGLAVASTDGWQLSPALASDGAGGAFVAWTDLATHPATVRAQHVLAGGTLDPAWPASGLMLAFSAPDSSAPVLAPDGAGGFYAAWDDIRNGHADVWLQRVTATGAIAIGWPAGGMAAGAWTGRQHAAALVASVSGVTLAWLDDRGGVDQVFTCRVLPNGSFAPGWPDGGRAVAPSDSAQRDLQLARADVGGMRLAWSEDRGAGSGLDIYAQRLDSTGTSFPGWPASGALVCASPGNQDEPAMTVDGAGGAYFTWTDRRDSAATGLDLYVQRLDAAGTVAAGWPSGGFALCTASGDQREARLTGNGHGGAFVAWTDGRHPATSGDDIACREVGPGGPSVTRAGGLSASHRDGQTFLRWTAPPGRGWTYRLYESAAPIQSTADLAAATMVGSASDSSACDLRLSRVLGTVLGFRIDPAGPELPPQSGLFVRTVTSPGERYYALTSTPGGLTEDAAIVPGDNALVAAVAETVTVPRPVYQRTVVHGGPAVEIWTLWTWHEDLPGFPAMTIEPGLPFDCGIVRGQSAEAPLVVGFHARRGSLFDGTGGMFLPGEWVLALDDMLPNQESTFWYGYHRGYDIHAVDSPPPLTGEVVDFTARRVDWTLDWVRGAFPIDTTRVFAYGYSMGAMGATQLAFRAPHKLAGVMSVVGQFDFSFLEDPMPGCWFNPGGPFRLATDQIWGAVGSNLPAASGSPVFELLNGTRVAENDDGPELPPLMAFNGRRDVNVGWAEKTRFWAAMQAHRRGGYFFWDNRDHGVNGAAWIPMQVPGYLDRFRTDRSFPALSNGDADGVMGDGSPASGDTVGTLNGHVEWDVPSEEPQGWSVNLTLRPLALSTGGIPAPESVLVDVTPRRLRAFAVAPRAAVPYRVVRVSDGALLASGLAASDDHGVLTVARVRVHRSGTRLELGAPAVAGVAPAGGPAALRLAFASPARAGALEAAVDWPSAEAARLDLLDVAGRRVLTLFEGLPAAGRSHYAAREGAVAPGLYFLSARCGAQRAVRRVVVLR